MRPNEYTWSRETFGPVRVRAGADLAGSSLVETGVVDEDRYIDAVRWIARSRTARRYLAHRRESAGKLERIAGVTGMEIVHPELPLELTALTEPIGQSVLTFASTIAYTLPIVLRGAPVRVELCEIDDDWITPDTAERSVDFLRRISALAVDRHNLARIPPQPRGRSHAYGGQNRCQRPSERLEPSFCRLTSSSPRALIEVMTTSPRASTARAGDSRHSSPISVHHSPAASCSVGYAASAVRPPTVRKASTVQS